MDFPSSEKRILLRRFFYIGTPIFLQNLISSSLSFIDNLIIGNLGENELAISSLSTQMHFIFWMLLFGFSSGAVTYLAQYFGIKDMVNLKKVFGINLIVNITFGLIFFTLSLLIPNLIIRIFTNEPEIISVGTDLIRKSAFIFLFWSISTAIIYTLRATEQTKIPFIVSLFVLSTNTFLCFSFAYGFLFFPAVGVYALIYAITIARSIELIIYLVIVFGFKNKIKGTFKEYFSFSKELLKKVVKNALPTTVNEFVWGFGFSLYNACYARISIVTIAATQAGTSVFNIMAMATFGIGDAVLILVGEELGKGLKEKAYAISKYLLKISIIVGLVLGGLLVIISFPVSNFFNFSEEGRNLTITVIIIYGIFLFEKSANSVFITGVLRSGGDTRFAMLTESLLVWLVGVPLAFLTAVVLKLPIYICIPVVTLEEVFKIIVCYLRFRSKKWMNTLV